jgi:hemolysin D
MPRSPQTSSTAISTAVAERGDPTLPIILEYQSPSTAIVNAPMPRIARGLSWTIGSMVITCFILAAVIKIDRVVTAQGKVIEQAPTIVVQPLETSIVRTIDVREGDAVHAGQVLARLDPTFAAADMEALKGQVATYAAQAARMQAEIKGEPFNYAGSDPHMALEAATYAGRMAEYSFKLENYQQKQDGLTAQIAKAQADIAGFEDRLTTARALEKMRNDLDKMGVGSRLNTLSAIDNRAEMQRQLEGSIQVKNSAQRDLAALIAERNGYVQSWHADVAEKLADATSKLSDARESFNKAQLKRNLVEMRAEQDSIVLSIAKVSKGSVLNAGQQFITLVPSNAPLEVEVNISGSEGGYVHVGDPVAIKFDTFPFTQYGMAHGTVQIVSPDSFNTMEEERNPTGAAPLPTAAASGVANGTVWYRAHVSLDQIGLHDTPEGFRLSPGMPVTSDVLVGKRTIMGYFLGRVMPFVHQGMREP